MPKLPDTLDAYTAPWEKEGAELDPAKAKHFVYTLLKQNEGLTAQVATVTGERDALQTKVDEAETANATDAEKLQKQLDTANKKLEDAAQTAAEKLRLEVAIEKGLSATQARRLVGTTKEELLTDADELVESFGGSGNTDTDDGETPPRGRPRQLRNPADPDPGAGVDLTFDTAADKVKRIY